MRVTPAIISHSKSPPVCDTRLPLCGCRVRISCLEKLLGLSPDDARRVAAAEPALLTFR